MHMNNRIKWFKNPETGVKRDTAQKSQRQLEFNTTKKLLIWILIAKNRWNELKQRKHKEKRIPDTCMAGNSRFKYFFCLQPKKYFRVILRHNRCRTYAIACQLNTSSFLIVVLQDQVHGPKMCTHSRRRAIFALPQMHGKNRRDRLGVYMAFMLSSPLIKTASNLANVDLVTCDGNFIQYSRFGCGHRVPVFLGAAFFFILRTGKTK